MSQVLMEMCGLILLSHIRLHVYHPQTDERFNKTLKQML